MTPDPPPARTRVGTLRFEAGRDGTAGSMPDLSAKDEWHVLVTLDAIPIRDFRLPSPGRCEGTAMLEATVAAHAAEHAARREAIDALGDRMGVPETEHHRPSCTVVICTRDRPAALERVLAAVGRLDPAPDEVLVVDSAPGAGDCRALVKRFRARYLRVDEPGLNVARAAATAVVETEVVAFTDDDCEPPPNWLSELGRLFSDATVGVVTGPAFAASLESPAARIFEEAASFNRGLDPRLFDSLSLSPVEAARAGAGANMIFRRTLLDDPVRIFPPELDAGTATSSAGDVYAFYRALTAGWRISYDPGTYTIHHHRSDPVALRRVIRGYGTGLAAIVTKLLVEERQLSGVRVLWWLTSNYAGTAARGLTGSARPAQVWIAWNYLRGAAAGPRAWLAARASAGDAVTPAPPTPRAAVPVPDSEGPGAELPAVTVIVPTAGRPEALGRCLDALRGQRGAPTFDVVVVDDGTPRGPEPPAAELDLKVLASHGSGAATARNTGAAAASGEVLLFLDDDLVPAADLVRRHAEAHAGGVSSIAIGYSPPRPVRPTLAALSASLWWEDHFRRMASAAGHTFVEVLSGNMSIRAADFGRVGGYDPVFGRGRREDWEWGLRAARAGVGVRYLPTAVAEHHFRLDSRSRLSAARAEGRGDALLIGRHPEAIASLPLARQSPIALRRHRIALVALASARVRNAAISALEAAECAGSRKTWAVWFNLVQRAAYEAGLREGGARRRHRQRLPVLRVELDSREPIPPPLAAVPVVELAVKGERVARVVPRDGQWNRAVAVDAIRQAPLDSLPRMREEKPATDGVGVTVLAGEGRLDALEHRSIEVAGAKLVELDRGTSWWHSVDAAIREADTMAVAVVLPGHRVSRTFVPSVGAALSGDRVALALCADAERTVPWKLIDRRAALERYPTFGRPASHVAFRRDAYAALGGIDTELAQLGLQAPILAFAEGALEAGYVVGYSGTGLRQPRWDTLRVLDEWRRGAARGALLARDARQGRPGLFRLGFLSLGERLWQSRRTGGTRGALGTAVAFTWGVATAGVRRPEARRHPTPPAESPPWWSSSASIPAPRTRATAWSSRAAARWRRSTAG